MALPGVKTTILDRFYNQRRTDLPGGPLVAIIAKRSTAATVDAPDLKAYFAISELDVINQFGDGSYLHRAYYELTTSGYSTVALIALPANTTFNHTTATITSSGFNNGDLFDAAFAEAEAARADIVVAWGKGTDTLTWDDFATPATPGGAATDYFYADNSVSSSWVTRIANKCQDITINSYPVFGVIGVKGLSGPENPAATDVASAIGFTNLVDRSAVVNGNFINVVATEIRSLNAPTSWGWSNGCCTYAAIVARLASSSATTGKPVYNVNKLRYNVTRPQADTLTNKGLVTIQLDFQGVARWVDGTTFAPVTSDYVRLSTMRIIFDAVKLIKSVSQSYIGEGMSIQNRNAFETQIASALMSMQKANALVSSDFRVQYAPSENKAYVDLAVVPAFELREIYVNVSVNF